jgi:hypothetical protein
VLADAVLPNVPVPLLDQAPDAEFVDDAEMLTASLPHVEYGPPALLVGAGWIVSVALATAAAEHGAVAPAVSVNIAEPLLRSPGPGVYVVIGEPLLANVPSPLVAHDTEDWFETEPFRLANDPEQVEYGPPALDVGGDWTVRLTSLLVNELLHASLTTTL